MIYFTISPKLGFTQVLLKSKYSVYKFFPTKGSTPMEKEIRSRLLHSLKTGEWTYVVDSNREVLFMTEGCRSAFDREVMECLEWSLRKLEIANRKLQSQA